MSTEPDTAPALSVTGLTHAFGKRVALDGAAFSIAGGEFAVLLGPNGAGKTTLFSLVTALYDNRSGSIRVYDADVRRDPGQALRQLGVVFQQRTLDLDLSVMQNLRYHAALHGIPGREAQARAERSLALVSMADRAKDKCRALSGGQMRRVEIARALLHGPRMLLLDEPTVGLDIASRQEIVTHVRRLCAEEGIGVLWATHLIDEVWDSDRLIILHKGQVKAAAPVRAVLAETGTTSVGDAFARLTGGGPAALTRGAAA